MLLQLRQKALTFGYQGGYLRQPFIGEIDLGNKLLPHLAGCHPVPLSNLIFDKATVH
jgi:hypothetical protein